MSLKDRAVLVPEAGEKLVEWCRDTLNHADTALEGAQAVTRRLGAIPDDGRVTFGFWTPELMDRRVPDDDVFLEILAPLHPLSLTVSHQQVDFERVRLPVSRADAYSFAVVDGLTAGSREGLGDFYCLTWRDADGNWHRVMDPLAASVPFGAFAPAEIYDLAAMQAERTDTGFWQSIAADGATPNKFGPPVNILQLHVPTATPGGTLASLTRHFQRLSDRVAEGLDREVGDDIFLGYDAVQLLPVEPTTVYETGPSFWEENADQDDGLSVTLTRPNTTNWGYDVVIAGMATVNPVLLESGRPDELVDLAAVLHNFPNRPKMLILDVVFGHSDNQGLEVLNPHYFSGPNMYGQNLDYKNPAVRAILLEMQRRKVNFGADGVRVDGAQDFKWWDPSAQEMKHDDDYLQLMADLEQEVAGAKYRPWMIFEDGRPWPKEDWELSSTYRSVMDQQTDDDVFQWGPLTFAHNTPFLYTFWLSKYWRIREMMSHGENWISGCANHDTLRRGTQVDPNLNINTRLGDTRMEIIQKAYDNPAVTLLTYAAFPGVPMEFINATARASWGFIRNQDDRYGVKVVAEEAISLKWQVDEYSYSRPGNFVRLKDFGYETRQDLARFLEILPALVDVTGYDLDAMVTLLNAVDPPLVGPETYTVPLLKKIARAWMDDMHEYCNVANSLSRLDQSQTEFAHACRMFRREHPWLRNAIAEGDHFDYIRPVDGRVVYVSHRRGPETEVLTLCHMEGGRTAEFDPLALDIPGIAGGGWSVALRTPTIGSDYLGGPITLQDSMGLTFTRPV